MSFIPILKCITFKQLQSIVNRTIPRTGNGNHRSTAWSFYFSFYFLYFACLTTIQISVKCSVENSRSNSYTITNRWQTLLFLEVWNWCSYYKNMSLLIDTCVRMTWLIFSMSIIIIKIEHELLLRTRKVYGVGRRPVSNAKLTVNFQRTEMKIVHRKVVKYNTLKDLRISFLNCTRQTLFRLAQTFKKKTL